MIPDRKVAECYNDLQRFVDSCFPRGAIEGVTEAMLVIGALETIGQYLKEKLDLKAAKSDVQPD